MSFLLGLGQAFPLSSVWGSEGHCYETTGSYALHTVCIPSSCGMFVCKLVTSIDT